MNTLLNNIKRRALSGIKKLPLLGLGGLMLVSCSDYLDILPLNDVVLENYWTKKDDVTSTLNSCYESLGASESILRLACWGEIRSENITQGGSVTTAINEILKENLLPTNTMTEWVSVYQTINRCNTVIYYAPSVAEKDPNYTDAQMKANVAEASFIRDLCYFYLIRTFRDVPMTFDPSIDDTKEYAVAATKMNDGLKMLSDDLEKVKDDAVLRYIDDSKMTTTQAASSAYENTCKVTRVAMYALLADIYLWEKEYDKAIECCDYVIKFKQNQYQEKIDNLGSLNDIYLFNGIPMIREAVKDSKSCGNAYTEIFGTGFSFESLFEVGYKQNSGQSNTFVYNYYGNSSTPLGYFSAPEDYQLNVLTGNNQYFVKNDARAYENMYESNGKYLIKKYVNQSISFTDPGSPTINTTLPITYSTRSNAYANWIFYRLSDVLLIKAEACIMKGEDNFETAFTLINDVNKRACNFCETIQGDTLKYADYGKSKDAMEELLMMERKREFMFEGKRWFDLVRKSLRDGSTTYLATQATAKQKENAVAIKIQLSDPNAMFWPYNRDELKKNNLLKQNSAYSDSEEFQK